MESFFHAANFGSIQNFVRNRFLINETDAFQTKESKEKVFSSNLLWLSRMGVWGKGLLHSPFDQMAPPFDREKRLFLSSLRPSRAEKAQGKHICSRRACSASQKCSSQRTGRCCGLHSEGLRPLQTTPGVFDFPVFTVAQSFMRTNIPVIKEDIADWLLQHPLFCSGLLQHPHNLLH